MMTREVLLKNAKPILFNTDIVRAILDGRKTVTRRVVKPQPKMPLSYTFAGYRFGTWGYPSDDVWKYWGEKYRLPSELTEEDKKRCWTPPCNADDILYVRETWQYLFELDGNEQIIEGTGKYYYAATDIIPFDTYVDSMGVTHERVPWKPSIHMPKKAARIFLKVKEVRVERLQDITNEQSLKEGAEGVLCDHDNLGAYGCTDCMNTGWLEPPKLHFMYLWDSTIKKSDLALYGWDANPWVWVIEFEQIEPGKEQRC